MDCANDRGLYWITRSYQPDVLTVAKEMCASSHPSHIEEFTKGVTGSDICWADRMKGKILRQ
jgi:hypothetical protein